MKNKKITIISSDETYEVGELKSAARRMNIDIDVQNIENMSPTTINKLGAVVYWRSASITSTLRPTARTVFMQHLIHTGKTLVNNIMAFKPYTRHKLYQQKKISWITLPHDAQAIPTQIATSTEEIKQMVENGELSFPFYSKPNLSACGKGIILCQSESDIDAIDEPWKNTYQNNIPNDGDFRIYIVNGKTIEIMKRVGGTDSFMNNISQGGDAFRVDDETQRNILSDIAETVAKELELEICGVDIIQDLETERYYFLEVNTSAQWQGLQSIAKVNIAEKVLEYLQSKL